MTCSITFVVAGVSLLVCVCVYFVCFYFFLLVCMCLCASSTISIIIIIIIIEQKDMSVTSNKCQSFHALKVSVLNCHDTSVGKQLFWIVIDELSSSNTKHTATSTFTASYAN